MVGTLSERKEGKEEGKVRRGREEKERQKWGLKHKDLRTSMTE